MVAGLPHQPRVTGGRIGDQVEQAGAIGRGEGIANGMNGDHRVSGLRKGTARAGLPLPRRPVAQMMLPVIPVKSP
ncbi:hypothetical protein MACH21_09280 [Roseicyclus marinus]|uniref:Uncharacterized protein n=1 Tax=Roseicyclus marinus TaxID=2161673 RepID=A0AA48KM48_9RHOB|nr:hypothetical protein MACH21_09280 [Roseicyclus marinus]